ncbi:MAG: cell division ATP-binding protein FtsE [Solirubrobacteraceae bacterium]|nr:MAG: cell division ATP-binding protein FtsE [Solirubrobacterales bacterium]
MAPRPSRQPRSFRRPVRPPAALRAPGAHPEASRRNLPAPSPTAVIEFRGISKHYAATEVALEQATFTIERGEFVFLVGATGSGKSTLMRLLIKELEPTAGHIRVAGRDLGELSRRRVPYLRRNIGTVFQDFKLLPNRTVHDNVAYALQVTGGSRKEIRTKVPEILRLTGLSTKLHHFPDQLSGGEQQRVAIARAFVRHPPLLLADEPTGNLDPETSIGIMQLLYRINRTGTTVLVATHDSAMVDKMRRRVIELSAGRIVRDEAAGLYAPTEETTREFAARLRADLRSKPDVDAPRPAPDRPRPTVSVRPEPPRHDRSRPPRGVSTQTGRPKPTP